jgi:hypothetical protein
MTKEVTFRTPPDSKSRNQKAFVRPHLKSHWELWREKRGKKKTIAARIKADDKEKDEERPVPHYTPLWQPHRTSTIFQSSEKKRANLCIDSSSTPQPQNFLTHQPHSQSRSINNDVGSFSFPSGPFPPRNHNNPAQAPPQSQFSNQHHHLPPMSNARHLQPGELNAHDRPGGQTGYGERVRGQRESVYVDGPRVPPSGGGRGGGVRSLPSGGRAAQHPWFPSTQVYEEQQTRRR